jgi:protein-disulfide isomerase
MSKLTPPPGPSDHVLGSPNAPVTLTEYGDYQCPFCGNAHQITQHLRALMGDRFRFVFRNFPLTQVHPQALLAAEAAEAAGAQWKFWAMHDMLYENQEALEPDDLLAYAETLRLDMRRFADELRDQAHLDRVKRDFRSGVRSGVNGTPTFFIDDDRHDASWDPDTLRWSLEQAIQRKQSRGHSGPQLRGQHR